MISNMISSDLDKELKEISMEIRRLRDQDECGKAWRLHLKLKAKIPYPEYIAISGKKGSGKTYLAKEIKKELSRYGVSVEILSIAEPIKEIAAILLGQMVYSCKNDPRVLDLVDCTVRETLQKIGTCLKETFSESLWIDKLIDEIEASSADYIIIDDLRFDTELKALEECLCGVRHIHIDYKHQDNSDTHISENSISITDDTLVIERD